MADRRVTGVDIETECLSLRGWLGHQDLAIGDRIIAIDLNGRAVASEVRAIHAFDKDIKALHFDGSPRRFSMVLAPETPCIFQDYDSKQGRWSGLRAVAARGLKGHHHLLRAPLHPMVTRAESCGPSFSALLGWIAAEGEYGFFRGCVHRTEVKLSQSMQHNPEYVEQIQATLAAFPGQSRRCFKRGGEMSIWSLSGALRKDILAAMPNKRLTFNHFAQMSNRELAAIIDAFAKGDGHKLPTGSWLITQKANHNTENLDVLQAMALVLADPATMGKNNGAVQHLHLHCGKVRPHRRTMFKQLACSEITVPRIWSPVTEHGTWLARRNGSVFLLGDAGTSGPIQFNLPL